MQFANEFKYRPVQLGLYVNISTASTLSQHLVQRDTESPPPPPIFTIGGQQKHLRRRPRPPQTQDEVSRSATG